MAHRGPIGISAIAVAILLSPSQAVTYTARASSGTYTACNGASASDTCNIYCNKVNNGASFTCGAASICNVDCTEKKCMSGGTISAQDSSALNVVASADECMKAATVSVPTSGDATFSLQSGGTRGFTNMIVEGGTGTQSITISCSESSTTLDECRAMKVYAQNAQYLRITGGSNSEIGGDDGSNNDPMEIYCPQTSSYSGPEPAPCIIDGNGGTINLVNVYALGGFPRDAYIYPGISNTDITIYCNSGFTSSTAYPSVNSNGICHAIKDTTASPTTVPVTRGPTGNPSRSPSGSPTERPTKPPTKLPTKLPTDSPTTGPISTPSPSQSPITAPTKGPTSNPSAGPTKFPSKSPTRAPTKVPTGSPSEAPTKRPTAGPSHGSTESATATPTVRRNPAPSISPTHGASAGPTRVPSLSSTVGPTSTPTAGPTDHPSVSSTAGPTSTPSTIRTSSTARPTANPTQTPSEMDIQSGTVSYSSTQQDTDVQHDDETDDEYRAENNSNATHILIYLALLIIFVLALCICTGCICIRYKKKSKRRQHGGDKEQQPKHVHPEPNVIATEAPDNNITNLIDNYVSAQSICLHRSSDSSDSESTHRQTQTAGAIHQSLAQQPRRHQASITVQSTDSEGHHNEYPQTQPQPMQSAVAIDNASMQSFYSDAGSRASVSIVKPMNTRSGTRHAAFAHSQGPADSLVLQEESSVASTCQDMMAGSRRSQTGSFALPNMHTCSDGRMNTAKLADIVADEEEEEDIDDDVLVTEMVTMGGIEDVAVNNTRNDAILAGHGSEGLDEVELMMMAQGQMITIAD